MRKTKNSVFTIEAHITTLVSGSRVWFLQTGDRPGFSFIGEGQHSGSIKFLNTTKLSPGESAQVEITFISDYGLGPLHAGTKFRFYTGPKQIGAGEVIRIIGWS